MQAQAQVGILCTIFGGLLQRHLIEADLIDALAAQLLVGDGFQSQMA